jgi:glycosyltransferase involved in cell wall biosynthesis
MPAEAVPAPDLPHSLCMIVKNEEKNLPDCLRSAAHLFAEVVIADTGSTDATREVARSFGARVVEFPWVDSFAAARNASLRAARGKWVMWLDADDRLDAENQGRLAEVLAGLGDDCDARAVKVRSALDAGRTAFRLLDQVRIFRNHPAVRWDYRIHEQILPAVNRLGGAVRWLDVVVDHVGYQDAGLRQAKLERNLRLLEMEAAERPEDSFALFNLGWTLLDLGRTAEARGHLEKSLANVTPHSSIVRKLYHLLSLAHRHLGEADRALEVCRQGLDRFGDDGELLLEEGLLCRDGKDWPAAERSWQRLLRSRKGNYFASEEVGLRGFRTRQLLAELYLHQGRLVEAEVQWRAALTERAAWEPAWLGLAEVYLRQARWADLDGLLDEVDGQGAAPAKAGWVRARGQLHRQEFGAARRTLRRVVELDPAALGPRVLLSQALLQEGRDWDAAEQALLEVLELDPENREARGNLQVLRRQRRRPAPVLAEAT